MALPKITLEPEDGKVRATCADCGHTLVKASKKTALQNMIGHLAGRHGGDIASLLAGNLNIDDRA